MMWYRCKIWIVSVTACILLLFFLYDRVSATIRDETRIKQKIQSTENGQGIDLKQYLSRYLGIPYRRGGISPKGFDCSGFARFIYKTLFDFDLPHNSSSQYRSPLLIKVPHNDLKPGDLIFFASTPSKKRINHVGIYLDDNTFIHAENKRGITLSRLDDAHWRSRLVSVKRPVLSDAYQYQDDNDFSEPGQNSSDLISMTIAQRRLQAPVGFSGLSAQFCPSPASLFMLSYTQVLFTENLKFRISRWSIPDFADRLSYTIPSSFYSNFAESETSGGYNIAADFVPFHGLCISPFLMLHDRRDDTHGSTPVQTAGLHLSLFPTDTHSWSLAATMQQSILATGTRATLRNHEKTSDWSFTYHRRLSDTLRLSFTGEHIRYPFLISTSDSAFYDQRFFFQLHFAY